MNVNLYVIEDYRKKDDFVVRTNKPNFQNGQNERKLTYNKGLQKKRLFSTPKNKPKTNPISSKAKMNVKSLAKKSGHTLLWIYLNLFLTTASQTVRTGKEIIVPLSDLNLLYYHLRKEFTWRL
jgi:hypothetical protein